MVTIVIDTNILVAALQKESNSARRILRLCLLGEYQAIIGAALFAEYEDVLGRDALFDKSVLHKLEREQVFNGFLSMCKWCEVFYAWRPNLPDEADNHLIELAIAGQAQAIVTRNLRDLAQAELKFPNLQILNPEQFLQVFSKE